ncbi:MAG: hypothetical protein JXM69_12900 [Anaerolineae bacterium]|nr:hypothetical protein [Anaerolineae bacterium]
MFKLHLDAIYFSRPEGTSCVSCAKRHPFRYPQYVIRGLAALIVLIFHLSLFPLPTFAQSPDASVEFFVKSPEPGQPITVGDQITLRLEIKHPRDSRVVLPQLEQQWQGFEVVDQTAPEIVDNGDGMATTGKDIIVTLFAPGEYQTPALSVSHRQPDGSMEELAAPVIPIQVTSVLTEDVELRDLKAQVNLPVPPMWPWILGGVWLAMVLAVLLTAAGLWVYQRWQNRPIPGLVTVPFIDTRPPEVIAHAELNRIEALDLPARQQIKEHYILVSDCLRRYIEGRYHLPALEQTTGELRAAFSETEVPLRDVSAFMRLFSQSDLVKFARYLPQADEVYQLIDRARIIVAATTPEPDSEVASPTPEVGVPA